jgi:hypothetical protein
MADVVMATLDDNKLVQQQLQDALKAVASLAAGISKHSFNFLSLLSFFAIISSLILPDPELS